ncbi:MAG: ABC transporter ATP-binding protein [Pigmentiphaga sp.]|uniref:ABC transporter ATP-binding protein n=1 Tax=Pigmentiphaga sp. TaxID=1977564 RepID=UPI0029A6D013|nr:ABC transporter ATP-binding protein [Pigmentiphaga sp.]MDX3906753.1 ABC transporter ATP-binding protein [Pigmentiphaga sp.]
MTSSSPSSGAGTAGGPQAGIGERVLIQELSKRYRNTVALDNVSLEVGAGELVSILGPSGSGKTTTLMIIAGFSEGAYSGQVLVGGRRIDDLPPNRRGIGVVFQHLELFPHMTVEDNIAFPLRMRGEPRSVVQQRVGEALELVQLSAFGKRIPAQLSGGQRQRVALARAVVYSPPVLLLDEPFGALDKSLREDMQAELRALNRKLGITVIHVTHDQAEAMAISDRIVVMNKGRIEQVGTPHQLYFNPESRFVGSFVGESVFIDGAAGKPAGQGRCEFRSRGGLVLQGRVGKPLAEGQEAALMLRPESVRLGAEGAAPGASLEAVVVDTVFGGERRMYTVAAVQGGEHFKVSVPSSALSATPLAAGERVHISWSPDEALILS